MRCATMLVLGVLFAGGALWAGEAEPPDPGEEPKTEEEILRDEVVEILVRIRDLPELPREEQKPAWRKIEADLLDLGPSVVHFLEPLIPRHDEHGILRPSGKLRALLDREDWEAASLFKRVMEKLGWVSEEDRKRRETLLADLEKKDSRPTELASQFAELGLEGRYGVEGLKQAFETAGTPDFRRKILDVIELMASQGVLETTGFLLDLTVAEDAGAREVGFRGLMSLTRPPEDPFFLEDWKKHERGSIDAILRKQKAYPMLVGFLRLDDDKDVRMYAGRILGNLGVEEAAEALVQALEDPEDRVQGEAADALLNIAGSVEDPGPGRWNALVRALSSWWRSNRSKLPPQLKPSAPVRVRPKPPGESGETVEISGEVELPDRLEGSPYGGEGENGGAGPGTQPGGESVDADTLEGKILEILFRVRDLQKLPYEERAGAAEKAEADLYALGPEAVPLLSALLPRKDENGIVRYAPRLKEILGWEDAFAVGMIERVLRRHGWISAEDRKRRKALLEDLKKEDSRATDLASQFAELGGDGAFGVAGLKEAYAEAEDEAYRDKILDVIELLASQGVLATADFLLDLTVDADPATRKTGFKGLVALSETPFAEDREKLHGEFEAQKAYPMFVGFLRLDGEKDVRMWAARILGHMRAEKAVKALLDALDDPEDRVQGEAAEALLNIAGTVDDPGPGRWDALIRSLKSWWRKSRADLPEQLEPAAPVRVKPEKKREPGD